MRESKSPATVASSVCGVDGCDRMIEIKARGLCRRHYQKWRTYGDPSAGQRRRSHPATCEQEGCERPWRAKGLCESHYRQQHAPDPDRPITDEIRASRDAFFWANLVQDDNGCWIWQRPLTGNGYGQMRGYRGATSTHRFAYQLLVGPIPDGMEIDHLCKVRACCNPGHLDVVPRPVNLSRSDRSRPRNGRAQAAKTHCPRNHPYDDANTYINPRGQRICRTCNREKAAKRHRAI